MADTGNSALLPEITRRQERQMGSDAERAMRRLLGITCGTCYWYNVLRAQPESGLCYDPGSAYAGVDASQTGCSRHRKWTPRP
jgi:hypothetical protein